MEGLTPVTWDITQTAVTQQPPAAPTTASPSSSTTPASSLTSHSPEVQDADDAPTAVPQKKCTVQQYDILKDNLLLYHHTRLLNEGTPGVERGYLVGLMFSHFDSNNNGVLDSEELVSSDADVKRLSEACSLKDLLRYDDLDTDGHLNLNEFYTAFRGCGFEDYSTVPVFVKTFMVAFTA
ncbi:SPARC/Testican calcium-binding domain [Trinorchestia longiramus]|nr:SPARC/Testican calcium-binding domain [Trinorchestia longiramus]